MKSSIKKVLIGCGTVVALLLVTVSFQNCSSGNAEDASTTVAADGYTGDIYYPSNNSPVVLAAGQNITLKIAKPTNVSDLSSYYWVLYDTTVTAAYVGYITQSGSYFYVSLQVRSDLSAQKDLRIYLYNYNTKTYLDGNGIKISLRPAVSNPYSSDYVTEVCNLKQASAPTFTLNKASASSSALYIFDNGAGVGNMSCSIGGVNYNCLSPSSWPSNWTSASFSVTAYNRCGVARTQAF
ncbi:hypothetical protein B9G69_002860 [Bdellovibrio sp. SKB1291214]|uniref:hypothetical protein n=1 Tax=Bdellovibrio sp. SKB1291214 TaxID=1732569 RepID=UPI000B51ABA3|nr:hypothetical protein [Bdellovibrio sp. SKB1291214]UYL09513.1 hypothetical protein B9G69_002860 [Bdellovibrio sp. SKB1291214]